MITPTRQEKLEWSRCAQAAYGADRNDIGHKMSGAASIRDDQRLFDQDYDIYQGIYRNWLVWGRFGEV